MLPCGAPRPMLGPCREDGPLIIHYAVVTLGLAAGAAAVSSSESKVVERDRAIYEEINAAQADGGAVTTKFYNDSDGMTHGKWHRLPSGTGRAPKSLERMEVSSIAGQVRKVIHQFTSLSGDWVHTDTYYYAADGRLAFCLEEIVTFNGVADFDKEDSGGGGPFIVEARHYFDENGARVRVKRRTFVKSTGKELPLQNVQQQEHDDSLFRHVANLPVKP